MEHFLNSPAERINISVQLVKKLSPDSFSVMEFKNETDIAIANKMVRFPLLGENLPDNWNLTLSSEFNMTTDSHLFRTADGDGRLPLFEGKMIWQFSHEYAEPRYWVIEDVARKSVLGRTPDVGQLLDYQTFRLGYRDIASSTNERTLISSIIPPAFHGNKLPTVVVFRNDGSKILTAEQQLYLCGVWNSFVLDWMIRGKVSTTLNFFHMFQLPVPRLNDGEPIFESVVSRVTKLICTTPEFDDLAREVGLGTHRNGVTDHAERQTLRAELDAIIAHLYGLTEDELIHILATFPLVSDEIKAETLQCYRIFAPHPDDPQLKAIILAGEQSNLEFKVAAYWNKDARPSPAKDESMKLNITEAVAAFANSLDGGSILIGVQNDKQIIGLADDFKAANPQLQNRDGYERFLNAIIRANCEVPHVDSICETSFHWIDGKDICRIYVKPSTEPVYHKGDLIVRDGGGKRKLNAAEAVAYIAKRWKK